MIRNIEYGFAYKWFGQPPKKVFEVGCGEGWPQTFNMWRLQGFDLWAVDCRPVSDDPQFRCEDCRLMSFPDESFDVVYSISSVEHVGLKRYGDRDDIESGDRETIIEMGRVLKAGGILVVTLPMGHPECDKVGLHRLYDEPRLNKLFEGFEELEREYYLNRGYWYPSTVEQIMTHTAGTNEWIANVNVALRKPK